MFVDLPGPVDHHDPWIRPFEARFAALQRAGHRIAYFYERPDNSTFRYRVHNMIEVIDAFWPQASASFFDLGDIGHLDRVVDACDLLVICRSRYSDVVARLVQRARRRNVPVVFDIDDLVFDTQYVHLIMNTLAQPLNEASGWDSWFAYVSRLGATLRLCDRAITTNAFLAARIRDFSGVECAVVPNFMNQGQIEVSNAVWQAKKASSFARDETVHVGYFSGSPTHKKDFALAETGLAGILERFDEVRIRLVGYMEPAGALLSHVDRIDWEPFQDHVNLQRLIGSTEINVAPLQDNAFTNCKSELKYFEAAITGTATIASPTFTFVEAIRHGENARLALAHQWEDMVATTIGELTGRQDDYVAMAEQARAHAQETYGWDRMGETVRAALS